MHTMEQEIVLYVITYLISSLLLCECGAATEREVADEFVGKKNCFLVLRNALNISNLEK